MKYEVMSLRDVEFPFEKKWDESDKDAFELRRRFGLDLFSLEEIKDAWRKYSAHYHAGWLCPCKDYVEECFGIVLLERE